MPTASRRATPTEHQIQAALFAWRDIAVRTTPELALLHAIPNGAKLPFRNKVTKTGRVVRVCPQADYLKREGLTPGVLDVFWPVPRGQFHGLYIEHKAGRNGLTKEQQAFRHGVLAQGYCVMVSYDSAESIDIVKSYWELGPFLRQT